jgi:hypothetical protein
MDADFMDADFMDADFLDPEPDGSGPNWQMGEPS